MSLKPFSPLFLRLLMDAISSPVLIVDDEYKFLKLLKEVLADLPIIITTAVSGEEAIEIIKNNKIPFKLIISDYNMGEMNGIEFLRLSRIHSPPSIRIIMTAGLSKDELVDLKSNGDIEDFSIKPIIVGHFIDQVEKSIERYDQDNN